MAAATPEKRCVLRKSLPYVLIAPSIIILLSLVLYPMGFALVNSFQFWNLQTSPTPMFYSGLDNYRMVFQVTPFTEALKQHWNMPPLDPEIVSEWFHRNRND